MNIFEAIQAMRQGKKVKRNWTTVSKSYLIIENKKIEDEDEDEDEYKEIIYFVCEPITKEHNWVTTTLGSKNKWTLYQEDILADDWVIID